MKAEETTHGHPLNSLDEDAALRQILEGTAKETGERFFFALVENLAKALDIFGAWVTIWHGETRLRAVAFWLGDRFVPDYEYELAGTPCEPVFRECRLVHIQDRLVELYPNDPDLKPVGAVSYMGVPLLDVDGAILGHLAILDKHPLPAEARVLALFRIFAARAGAELRRLRAEHQITESEERLRRLFDSAMDAIVEVDSALNITRMNPAAGQTFNCTNQEMSGRNLCQFLPGKGMKQISELMHQLDSDGGGRRSVWIPGRLQALMAGGRGVLG